MSKTKKPPAPPPAAAAAPITGTSDVVVAEKNLVADELVTKEEYRRILLSQARKSPDNRKFFNEEALTELAASIKAMGVVQPILVRPVTPTAEQPEIYEIVAGERRYRASIIAGLLDIPAMVRVLSDVDAAKIRILENLQREDPHPMEEAEGYQLLMLQHGYNADQLADEIKKSRAYIYGRLKLCALTTEVREEFVHNKVSASTALLIARIPVPSLQIKALNEIQRPQYSTDPLSHRAAALHIQQRYMLDLTAAIFKITDAKLVPTAGACGPCPKRAGNQPEVFEGIGANVCTDPECFGEKRAAHHAAIIAIATKEGIAIVEGQERKAIYDARWQDDSDLLNLDMHITRFKRNAPATKNEGSPKTLLADEKLPAVALYTKEADGSLTPWYKRTALQAALEETGACETVEQHAARMENAPAGATTDKKKTADDLKWEQAAIDAQRETDYRVAVYKKLRAVGAGNGFSLASLREFAKRAVHAMAMPDDLLGDVYDFDASSDASVCAYVDTAGLPAIQLLLIDLVLGEALSVDRYDFSHGYYKDDDFSTVIAMAKHEGIDPDDVREDLFPTPINVDEATQETLRAFIRRHPHRIDELTKVVLSHERGELTQMLERAANELAYVYSGQSFQAAPPQDAAPAEICPSLSTTIGRAADDAAFDGEFLSEMMADPEPPTKAKKKPAKGKSVDRTVVLEPATAWPFPKTSTAARDPKPAAAAEPVDQSTETTQELTA